METITIPEAMQRIEMLLQTEPRVNVYGRWHSAPANWTKTDLNIDAGFADPSPDHNGYYERFTAIAMLLRTKGHIVANHGSSLSVCKRGTADALKASVVQDARAGISDGDIVILSHNLGVECKRVIRTDNEFLHFENDISPMTRGWVCDLLRTEIPLSWFKRPYASWIRITNMETGADDYSELDLCHCLSAVFRKLAQAQTSRRFKLAAYDGWSEGGGPGKLIAELGQFEVRRVGMQVFVDAVD